jgi:hypothetical protein
MGARVKARVPAFEESLDVVRRLLRGDVVSSSGRFQFRDGRVNPRPAEPVEFWLGATAEPAIDRAARLGDAWLASPGLTPKQAGALVTYYKERCRAHGKTPSAVAIRRDIYVGESAEEADAVAGARVRAGYRGFSPDAPVYGSIDTVAAKFRELGAMGYTDVIIRHLVDDQAQVLASYGRLAEVRKAVASMSFALDGVRVLELARFQAGPRGGMILSDLGAEVIKIEALGGEETRKHPPMVRGQSVYFSVYNRGKKSLCLDCESRKARRSSPRSSRSRTSCWRTSGRAS